MNCLSARVRIVAGMLAVSVGVLASSCGIAPQPEATRLPPEDVPFGLLDEVTTTQPDVGRSVVVYLLSGGRLLAVDRTLPREGTLADLLTLVVTGPSESERALGITTALPAGSVATVATERGAAAVDLTAAFGELRSSDQILALAQIVYVLTGQPGIGAVAFTLDGDPIEVPRTDGTASDAPLTRDDVEALAPA